MKGGAITLSSAEDPQQIVVELGEVSDETWTQHFSYQERVRTRLSKKVDGSHPIVGIWKYPHSSRGAAYERYRGAAYERYHANGLLEFRWPVGFTEGTWNRQHGETLCLSGVVQTVDSWTASLRDGVLVLSAPAGDEESYEFVRTEPWYEREPPDPEMLRELQAEHAADSTAAAGTGEGYWPSGK